MNHIDKALEDFKKARNPTSEEFIDSRAAAQLVVAARLAELIDEVCLAMDLIVDGVWHHARGSR